MLRIAAMAAPPEVSFTDAMLTTIIRPPSYGTTPAYHIAKMSSAAFDTHRELLYVTYGAPRAIYVYSARTGAYVTDLVLMDDSRRWSGAIAYDPNDDSILVVDRLRVWLEVWQYPSRAQEARPEFVRHVDLLKRGVSPVNLLLRGIAIDTVKNRTLLTLDNSILGLSLEDYSFVFNIYNMSRSDPSAASLAVQWPAEIECDDRHARVFICSNRKREIFVLSNKDAEKPVLLSSWSIPGAHEQTWIAGMCVDERGNVIVCVIDTFPDQYNPARLVACAPLTGALLSTLSFRDFDVQHPTIYDRPRPATAVAADRVHGTLALLHADGILVFSTRHWPGYQWDPRHHSTAPRDVRWVVETMLAIRTLADESSVLSLVPNEMLFEIFALMQQQ